MREITYADTAACEESGAGGAPSARDSSEDCGEDQAEAAVSLQSKEHHGEVDFHTAAHGGLHVKASGYS